jgi:putative copper export protein
MWDWITEWAFHIHLLMAISWIGGSVFMFVLGITLRDKKAQQEVYPHVGPIFGWFEVGALIALLTTGFILGFKYHLFELLLHPNGTEISHALLMKAIMVAILTVATVIHFVVAYRTNGKERTRTEQLLSRSSSMLIFILNLFVMHYAIVMRNIL